jgi:hypothetical protein
MKNKYYNEVNTLKLQQEIKIQVTCGTNVIHWKGYFT